MSYDYARESYEASLADLHDYDAMLDDDEIDEPENRPSQACRCTDRMCGALDCSNCHPGCDGEEAEDA